MRSVAPDSFENLENLIIFLTSFSISFYESLLLSRIMGIASSCSVKLTTLVPLLILIISPPFCFSV
jgi:hypothetical protein